MKGAEDQPQFSRIIRCITDCKDAVEACSERGRVNVQDIVKRLFAEHREYIKSTATRRKDNCTRAHAAPVGQYGSEVGAPRCAFNFDDAIAENDFRMGTCHLMLEALDQITGEDRNKSGRVKNGLVAIEGRALTTNLRLTINNDAADVKQAKLKSCEQACGACSNDQDIGIDAIRRGGVQPCRSGTVTTRPSSASVTLIWQDSREFGRTS